MKGEVFLAALDVSNMRIAVLLEICTFRFIQHKPLIPEFQCEGATFSELQSLFRGRSQSQAQIQAGWRMD